MKAGSSRSTRNRTRAAHRACSGPCKVTRADGTTYVIVNTQRERKVLNEKLPTVEVKVPEAARIVVNYDNRDRHYN